MGVGGDMLGVQEGCRGGPVAELRGMAFRLQPMIKSLETREERIFPAKCNDLPLPIQTIMSV